MQRQIDELREATREANGALKDLIRERKLLKEDCARLMAMIDAAAQEAVDGLNGRLAETVFQHMDLQLNRLADELVTRAGEHVTREVNRGIKSLADAHNEFLEHIPEFDARTHRMVARGPRPTVSKTPPKPSVSEVTIDEAKGLASQNSQVSVTPCGPWTMAGLTPEKKAAMPKKPANATRFKCRDCPADIWASVRQMKLIRAGDCMPVCFDCCDRLATEAQDAGGIIDLYTLKGKGGRSNGT
jgi:hypothetical protein